MRKKKDVIFDHIEALQADAAARKNIWGDVLDAGTGRHSLTWLAGLPALSVTAVTASRSMALELERDLGARFDARKHDLVVGDWADATLLAGRRFDVVLADYLIGAISRVAPYYQDLIFTRLRPHLAPGGRLYVVGLRPWPQKGPSAPANTLLDLLRLKNAAFLIGGARLYREYPVSWIERQLARSGFETLDVRHFDIRVDASFVQRHARSARNAIKMISDPPLTTAITARLEQLEETLRRDLERGTFTFGQNYVVAATLGRPD